MAGCGDRGRLFEQPRNRGGDTEGGGTHRAGDRGGGMGDGGGGRGEGEGGGVCVSSR